MTEDELNACKPGETLYTTKSDRVVKMKLLLVRGGSPVLEYDGELAWHTANDLHHTRVGALLAFAAEKRKSANAYRKATSENHDKMIEAEAHCAAALAEVARETKQIV